MEAMKALSSPPEACPFLFRAGEEEIQRLYRPKPAERMAGDAIWTTDAGGVKIYGPNQLVRDVVSSHHRRSVFRTGAREGQSVACRREARKFR
jgi:hypothetical protein